MINATLFKNFPVPWKRICRFGFALLLFMAPAIVCATPVSEALITVTILKHDNLTEICRRYLEQPDNWREIARINRLENPYLIYPGKTLQIPAVLLKGIPMNGVVTFVKGSVMSMPPQGTDWVNLQMGDSVSQGTEVKTDLESAVEITFKDGASFYLRPGTTISIQTALENTPHYIFRKLIMPAGKTLMHIKKSTGQDSRFEIQTPSAVSAARGTHFRVSVDREAITRTEVLEGVVTVKGMGQEVSLDRGQGSLVRKGAVPGAPKSLLPPPVPIDLKALYQMVPFQFRLPSIDHAVSYQVMISTDPEFKNIVRMPLVQSSEPVRLEHLEDGTYYCQIQSIDDEGLEGLPSLSNAFEVRVNPMAPLIQKPLTGQEFRTDQVTLEWLTVPDAVTYQVQVAKDPDFKEVHMDLEGIKETRKNIRLDAYADYYFRIRSIAADQFKGIWSDVIPFVFLQPPQAPPVDAPQMDEKKIHIRWKDLGQDITYHVQMAKDLEFKEILLDSTVEKPEIVFEKPEKSGLYHIRISAVDSQGYEGPFTPPQNFHIKRFPFWEFGAFASWAVMALIIIF